MSQEAAVNELNTVSESELVTPGSESSAVETQAEVKHETTLFAEPVFHLGGLNITNSLLTSWAVVLILIAVSLLVRRRIQKIPRGLQNVFEIIVEGAMGMADSVTGDREKTRKIFPIVFAIFLFILLNNWFGLLPGIGTIGFIESGHGESVFVPLLRGGTADMNTTLALALFAVFGSNVFGFFTVGIWRHFNKYVNLKAMAEVPTKLVKEPTIAFVNPIKFFVGIIEIIGEVAKVASLSFRLFGNIFAGEVLLASMAVIFAYAVPIPFIFLEIIVGVIQALIFAMLTLVYFAIASTAEEH